MSKILRLNFIVIFIIFGVLLSIKSVEAAKKFVPKKTAVRFVTATGIPAIVSYRPDHLGLNLSFGNFNGLDSVTYSFTYSTNGIQQGVGGTITPNNSPSSPRELLFGTCSRSVCRYQYNLSNARLILAARYTNGKTASKTYKIKTYQ